MHAGKYILPMTLCVMALAAATAAGAAPTTVGLVALRPDGTRTLFTTERLRRNDRVLAQYPEVPGVVQCCVVLRIPGPQRPQTEVSDALNGRPVRAYVLPPSTANYGLPFVGAARVSSARESPSPEVEHILRDDPAGASLPSVCTSRFGVHLMHWKDRKPQTHLWLHLDHAVEPTCSGAVLKKFD